MKKSTLTPVLVAVLLAAFAACKKDKTDRTGSVRSAKQFTEQLGSKKQTVSINASALPQTVTLAGGTKITFPAGSLTKNGRPVSGTVTVEAYEMLKRSQVLLSGTNTNHISGAPLQSHGFIYIDVKANGSSVDNNLAVPVTISIPANGQSFTQIWQGVQNDAQQMVWQNPPQNADGQGGQRDVKGDVATDSFIFDFGNLGWINTDVFYSYSNPKTTVRVELQNNPGELATFRGFSGETFVYFCAKGSNVAAQLYTPDGPDKVKSYDDVMPVGVEGKFISFAIKDGHYYLAQKEATITANMSETLSLSETTQDAIQTAINALDGY